MKAFSNTVIVFLLALSWFGFSANGNAAAGDKPEAAARWEFLPDVVAEINGEKITKAKFLEELKNLPPSSQLPLLDKERLKIFARGLVDEMIDRNVLRMIVVESGIKPSPELVKSEFDRLYRAFTPRQRQEFHQRMKELGRKSIAQHKKIISESPKIQFDVAYNLWVDTHIVPQIEVSDDKVESFYRENQRRFRTPERAKIMHITIKCPTISKSLGMRQINRIRRKVNNRAETMLSRIKQGESFKKLAKESDTPSDQVTVELSGRGQGDMQIIANHAFRLRPGEVSNVIETPDGNLHIIKLLAIKQPGFIPFSQLKAALKRQMRENEIENTVRKRIQERKAKLKIKYNI